MSNPSSVAAPQKQMCQLLVFFVVYKHHLDKCPYKRPSPSRASSRASLLIKCPCKRPSPSRASSGASLLIKCPYKGGQARQAVQAGQARQAGQAGQAGAQVKDLEIACFVQQNMFTSIIGFMDGAKRWLICKKHASIACHLRRARNHRVPPQEAHLDLREASRNHSARTAGAILNMASLCFDAISDLSGRAGNKNLKKPGTTPRSRIVQCVLSPLKRI